MARIILNTDQVMQIALEIDSINKQLNEELEKSKNIINSLSNTYQGEASNAVREAYNSFATKYFQNYQDVINQYVQFLKVNVVEGGENLETHNIKLADQFK